jgi:hypothetical protein
MEKAMTPRVLDFFYMPTVSNYPTPSQELLSLFRLPFRKILNLGFTNYAAHRFVPYLEVEEKEDLL